MSIELAWVAGFVDGEGCIYLARRIKPQFVLTLSVSNTDLASLEKVQNILGVGTIHSARQLRKPHHKPVFVWTCSSRNAEIALRQLEPYLVTKKEQARIGLMSRTFVLPRGGYRKDQGPPNYEKLEAIKQQLSALKEAS